MSVQTPATEPRSAGDQHDAALALALGLLAASRRFDATVSRQAPARKTPLAADDPIVLAALGAVSLGRTLTRWLEEAVEPQAIVSADPIPDAVSTPRELLR